MASLPVLIIGKSGSGKTTSLRNFKPDEVAVINVARKRLPFKGKFDSFVETDDYNQVITALKSTKKQAIVIDDAGYLITNFFMRNHASVGGGNNVFAMYNQMADDFWKLIDHAGHLQDENKIVYFMMHEDGDEMTGAKPKTIGKLLDEKVCVEGLFTIVLRAECTSDGEHVFHTKSNGSDVTKTPMGMFDKDDMPNDLKEIDKKIREFYDMPPLKGVSLATKK